MIYVMSDLHGGYAKFLEMLNIINLSDDDTLYILGDVVDRGSKSLEILDYIRKPENKNIKLLMGNHELCCIDALLDDDLLEYWLSIGGYSTFRQLQEKDTEYTDELLRYLSSCPRYVVLGNYVLVHGGIEIPDVLDNDIDKFMKSMDQKFILWDRDFVCSDKYIDGYTFVCGHTPTIRFMKKGEEARIIHREGKILIDCGSYYRDSGGRLGCIRLDDLKEYYV